jgi:hypothetical protein
MISYLSIILALLIPAVPCYLIISLVLSGNGRGRNRGWLIAFLAWGIGVGAASGFFFLWLLVVGRLGHLYLSVELAVLILLTIGLALHSRKRKAEIEALPRKYAGFGLPLFAAAFIALALAALTGFTLHSLMHPHGLGDGLQFWNMHARFLFRGESHWNDYFVLPNTHAEYPLLVPATIARSWTYFQGDTPFVPIIVGCFFTFGTIGLLFSAVACLNDRIPGIIAAIALAGTSSFIYRGSTQGADIALSFFYLATLVLVALRLRDAGFNSGLFGLTGLAAALAAWTKNEGAVFFAIVIGTEFLVALFRGRFKPLVKNLSFILIAACPLILLIVYFKATAPVFKYFADLELSVMFAKLTDPDRHWMIIKHAGDHVLSFESGFAIVLFVTLIAAGRVKAFKEMFHLFLILFFMMVAYYFIYVFSPRRLDWHLPTSFHRLFIQLWPGILFFIFMVVGSAEKAREPDVNLSTARSEA